MHLCLTNFQIYLQTPTNDTSSQVPNNVPPISPGTKNRNDHKAWRDRLEQDPTRYEEHRKFETLRVYALRASMSAEQKKQCNEKTRLRMQIRNREKKYIKFMMTSGK